MHMLILVVPTTTHIPRSIGLCRISYPQEAKFLVCVCVCVVLKYRIKNRIIIIMIIIITITLFQIYFFFPFQVDSIFGMDASLT